MKVVIPVAGLGTRMLPATKAIPKEMLPLVDKPLIQYIVNECVAAGVKEIVLVTHASKNAIENHFDKSYELESTLEKRVKRLLLEEVQAICPKDVTIMHVRQGEAKGLGHAVLCAYPCIGNSPFAVVLPDVVLDEYTANQKTEKRVKRLLLEEVQAICPKDVTIMHVRQGEAKGLGHAVLCAYPCIGNSPFAVMLPDVILDEYTANQKTENLAAMIARYKATFASQIMVAPVPESDVNKYGIADCNGVEITPGDSAKIKRMVEKPDVGDAPSNLAVVGRYVLSEKIWRLLAKTPAGAGDEIQLTDAIDMLIEQDTVEAFNMTGKSHDCGDKLGYMNAFVEYGLRDAKLGADFKKSVEKILLEQ